MLRLQTKNSRYNKFTKQLKIIKNISNDEVKETNRGNKTIGEVRRIFDQGNKENGEGRIYRHMVHKQ